MIAWLAIVAASAHPGSFRIAAHDVAVVVDGDELVVHYYLEAPRLRPEDHDAPPQDVVPGLSELESGLIVRVNDEAVVLSPVGELEYRTSHTMAGVAATFAAELPPGSTELTVENGNYPDLPGVFRTGWGLGPEWRLMSSSLITLEDGQVARDTSRQWVQGDTARSSSVSVTRRGTLERVVIPVSAEPISAATTFRPGPLQSWQNSIPHPLWALLVLLMTPLAGSSARLPGGPSRLSAVGAGLGLGAFAAALTTVATPALPLGILLLSACSVFRANRWLGGWVALLALAAACPLWPWSIAVGVFGSVLATRAEPSRWDAVGVSLALALGALWALRLL